jgi:hypothetical protein
MIAFDNATSGGSVFGGTSLTFSHTCSGVDRVLLVYVRDDSGDTISGVTYNGVPMTRLPATVTPPGGGIIIGYYLIAPATGAHNVVISSSSSANLFGSAVSYTGVSQTGFPDSINTNTATSSSPPAFSTTAQVNSCYLVLRVRGLTLSAGNGALRLGLEGGDAAIIDKGPVNAGSVSITPGGVSSNWGGIIVSMAPSIPAGLILGSL